MRRETLIGLWVRLLDALRWSGPTLERALVLQANAAQDAGHYERAERALRELLSRYEDSRRDDEVVGWALSRLTTLCRLQAKDEAEPLERRLLELLLRKAGQEQSPDPERLSHMGTIYHAQGNHAAAEECYKQSLRTYEEGNAASRSKAIGVLDNLAGLYRDSERYAEAESAYGRLLEMLEEDPEGGRARLARGYAGLAHCHIALVSSSITSHHLAEIFVVDQAAAFEKAIGKAFSRTSMTADMAARPRSVTRQRWVRGILAI